jgi:hypothetical protein
MNENFTQPEPSVVVNPQPTTSSQVNPVPETIVILVPAVTLPSPDTMPTTQPSPNTMPNPQPSPNPQSNSNTMPCPLLSSNPLPYSNLDMVNETTNSSYWFPIVFTPTNFRVTLLSSNTEIFYSYSNDTCMPIIDYWEDDVLGCPCNSTWNTTGYYDPFTNSFMGGRNITPSECPPNTCQETFFLNDTQKYANLRLNVTILNGTVFKTLEITKMSICKEIGYAYGAEDILYSFVWGQDQPTQSMLKDDNDEPVVVITPFGTNVTIENASPLLPLSMIITFTCSFLFLLV